MVGHCEQGLNTTVWTEEVDERIRLMKFLAAAAAAGTGFSLNISGYYVKEAGTS